MALLSTISIAGQFEKDVIKTASVIWPLRLLAMPR